MVVPQMIDVFLVGAAAGAGQGLGQTAMSWLVHRWRSWTGTSRQMEVLGLVRNTALDVAQPGETAPSDTPLSHTAPGDTAPSVAAANGAETAAAEATAAEGGSRGAASGGDAAGPPLELVRGVQALRSASDWSKLLDDLRQFGVELPKSAAAELAQMQQPVLDRVAGPDSVAGSGTAAGTDRIAGTERALGRLAELAAEAFERAGIEPADLQRWQRVEDCLASEPECVPSSAGSASAPVAVAGLVRPSTWFAWTREELDQRLTTYLRRAVRRCDQACEQALRTHVDCEVSLLRELRNWRTDLGLLEQLLTSLPPLNIKTRSLRPLSGRGKEATRGLEDAALVATNLMDATSRLFQQPVGSSSWNQNLLTCRQATSQLTQHIRERRDLR